MDDEDLAGLRRSYSEEGLSESGLAPTWHEQFARWFEEAREAVTEPNAVVLATATPDGRPSARTVLLKGAGPDGLTFFSNRGSRKGRELTANPRATLLFPWHPIERQVIVEGAVEALPDEDADAYFATRPRGSQLGARSSPQSRVIAGREELDAALERATALFPEGTAVPRPELWGGYRVIPDTVEFWQGRANRLHDRLRFRREGGGWVVERLAP